MKVEDLKLPENVDLMFVLDSYDRIGNTNTCCYVFPDGTIENVRNKNLFYSFCEFNQISSSEVIDFDGYIFPKNLPICFFETIFDEENDCFTTEIRFTKNSIHLKELVLNNYIKGIENLEKKHNVKISEEILNNCITDEELEQLNKELLFEDRLENIIKEFNVSFYENEKYQNYISLKTREN